MWPYIIIIVDNLRQNIMQVDDIQYFLMIQVGCFDDAVNGFSSSVLEEDRKRAFNFAQVVDYQEKPITKEMIEKLAREHYSH